MSRLTTFVLLMFGALPATVAEPYPVKAIRIIAPAPPGSPVDIRARWTAERLSAALGQAAIVDHKPGAGGNIGTQVAARSSPDGYTLVIVHQGTLAQNPHLYARTGYDALADFAPITRLVESALMLAVHPELPARTVAELIQLAKRRPGQLSYGSSGIGTPPHMAGELFKWMAAIDVVHVPYKGASPALTDLIAGRIAFTIDNFALQLPQVRAGKLRALGVTGIQRAAAAPEIPTFTEAGVSGYDYRAWMGVAAPAGTPKEIIARLNAELRQALATHEAKEWFAAQGGEVIGDTPEMFAAVIRADFARWRDVIREAGIKAQ